MTYTFCYTRERAVIESLAAAAFDLGIGLRILRPDRLGRVAVEVTYAEADYLTRRRLAAVAAEAGAELAPDGLPIEPATPGLRELGLHLEHALRS